MPLPCPTILLSERLKGSFDIPLVCASQTTIGTGICTDNERASCKYMPVATSGARHKYQNNKHSQVLHAWLKLRVSLAGARYPGC